MVLDMIIPNLSLILITAIVFIVSGIPLHLAVKLFGGDTSLLKTALIVALSGIVVGIVRSVAGVYGGILSFIVLIWIYKVSFDLGWISTLLAWISQFVILVMIVLVIFLMLGASTLASFFFLA